MGKDEKALPGPKASPPSANLDAIANFLNQFPSYASAATAPHASTSPSQNGHPNPPLNGHDTSTIDDDAEEIDDPDVLLLLRQLDEANGMASGLEDKLDGLIEDLEGLLAGLEGGADNHPISPKGNTDTARPNGKTK